MNTDLERPFRPVVIRAAHGQVETEVPLLFRTGHAPCGSQMLRPVIVREIRNRTIDLASEMLSWRPSARHRKYAAKAGRQSTPPAMSRPRRRRTPRC
jgi:hypothetical protein